MKRFTSENFVIMPWKNGGGTTTQLFILPGPANFNLRISIATVSQDGPFSLFPDIERNLLILTGNGCELKTENKVIELTESSPSFVFQGEESISCSLLEGTFTDFNVMTARKWGKANVRKTNGELFVCKTDLAFVYDIDQKELIQLDHAETLCIDSKAIIVEIIKAG